MYFDPEVVKKFKMKEGGTGFIGPPSISWSANDTAEATVDSVKSSNEVKLIETNNIFSVNC